MLPEKEKRGMEKDESGTKPDKANTDLKRKAFIKTMGIVALDIIVLSIGISLAYLWSKTYLVPFSVSIMGIITFFGILTVSNTLSGKSEFTSGEIRQAITGAFVVLYFGLIPMMIFKCFQLEHTQNTLYIFDSLTYLVSAVVLFYFGSRTLENVIAKWPSKKEGE